ncbi:MAG: hypothetical protein AAFW69_00580 [Pseudomonadota bacterium]
MLRTVRLASCILVQGELVRELANGRLIVRVGKQLFEGAAVSSKRTPVRLAAAS